MHIIAIGYIATETTAQRKITPMAWVWSVVGLRYRKQVHYM